MSALLDIGERLGPVDLAVFDKDGTLIDVHVYWSAMIGFRATRICAALGLGQEMKRGLMESMGVDVTAMRIKPEGPVGIKKREIVLQSGVAFLAARGHGDQSELFIDVFAQVDRDSQERFDEIIKPCDGLHEMLEALQTRGCKVALATTDRSDRAAKAMDHLGLSGMIDLIVGADMVAQPKPAAESVLMACESLGTPPSKTVMVGDAPYDVLAGLNAKCLASIGVASGMNSAEELRSLTPHVVDGISSIRIV